MVAGAIRGASCRLVIAVLLACFLILVWIRDEAAVIKMIGTTKQYMKQGSANPAVLQEMTTAAINGSLHVVEGVNESNSTGIRFNETTNDDDGNIVDSFNNGTIVVHLSGEMGNHLDILAKALTVQLLAQEQYGIASTRLVLRHQLHPKWVHGRDALQSCFPSLRGFNFSLANTVEYDQMVLEQEKMLRARHLDPTRLQLVSRDRDDMNAIHETLSYWKRVLVEFSKLPNIEMKGISFPFLTVAAWCPLDMIDRYLDQIRTFFEFDVDACCKAIPDPEESVFHLRNFLVEMPKRGKNLGFEELSPNKTALELFSHLKRGDRVAITTRYGGNDVEPYVSALQRRGLQVRVVEGQYGTQDFCFLIKAQKELTGTAISTYVTWAAYLGDMKRASLYRVVSPNTLKRTAVSPPMNWTHAKLKDRVFFPLYKSEEQEANERQTVT